MNTIAAQFKTLFDEHQASLKWQPTAEDIDRFVALYQGICAGNERLNLTRITTPEDFWEKHLWDSLIALNEYDEAIQTAKQLIDVGTGGGFPGFPLAIAYPHWRITLLDATRKKINFLNELSEQLNLNTQGIADRAEAIGQQPQHRAKYDLATIRAVGKAATCVEYLLPLLKLGGIAILYRGQWTDPETDRLQTAIAQCGGTLLNTQSFTTPITHSQRTCIYIQKKQPTPHQFPRTIGIPKQSPLADV